MMAKIAFMDLWIAMGPRLNFDFMSTPTTLVQHLTNWTVDIRAVQEDKCSITITM